MIWREMREADMPAVLDISVRVHPGFPEGEAMFRNRLFLYPVGCLVLEGEDRTLLGYAVSHPSRAYAPPPLDTVLDALPGDADDYYIHDVALLAQARGGGQARLGIERLLHQGRAYPTASLVSVYGTAPFWSRFGFEAETERDLSEKLAPYGTGAVYMTRALR